MSIESWLNKKVLIVDDLPQVREDLKNILIAMGFTNLNEFDDGKPAWDALANEAKYGKPYDIIFSDINMPIMNGIFLLKKIRGMDAYKKTPVFMISTETEKDVIVNAILLGATDYIIKPYNVELVKQKIIQRLK